MFLILGIIVVTTVGFSEQWSINSPFSSNKAMDPALLANDSSFQLIDEDVIEDSKLTAVSYLLLNKMSTCMQFSRYICKCY